MLRGILFDLDNTLIDFMKMKKMGCEAAIAAMIDSGLEMDKRKAYRLLFKLYGEHGIEHQHIFQLFLKKTLGTVDYRILANAITAYRKVQVGFQEPYPRVRPTLIGLRARGLQLGVVSDAPKLKAWLRLAEMNLTHFFDAVITLGDAKQLKPSKKPFELALKQLGLQPFEVLYVGDNPARDIKGAKKVGMRTALAEYGRLFPARGVKPDFVLKRVDGVLSIADRLTR
ncbi:MAG TPA: HAD-IA family hydrolase [Candidatus Diapherotrites archaeon]|uniref:HAD-IA family hydrolase n=1 Tax=Candidatus Iainarchaeum sp. TaxID=3101447 RepID=A0A7J4JDU6_9ARCH|nr:HAD-IA family hydrolase [Candidatus Diapherotrites archaeon]HIH15878.1 HAD-IA family hydrolase [Candidatus Diapherotrites archaeon]